MGPVGCGKSQVHFCVQMSLTVLSLIASYVKVIDLLTGQPGKRARDTLQSVTKDVTAIRVLNHEKHGRHIVLVDTPGFDDVDRSDRETLVIISTWLLKTFVGFHYLIDVSNYIL